MEQMFIRRRLVKAAKQSFRLLFMVSITFFGLLLITFVIGRVVPIDPVLAVVGDKASPELYERVRIELGLHLPVWQQFFIYVGKVLRGDLGTSVLTAKPVLEDILRVFPATFELAFIATLIGVFVGIPLGVLSAVKRGSLVDHITRIIGLLGYSLPIFWLGLLALMFFYARLDLLPGPGRIDVFYEDIVDPVTGMMLIDTIIAREWDIFKNALSHMIMPASLLGYYSLAYLSRMTRSFMLEQLRQEYVLTARVKGLLSGRLSGDTPLVTVPSHSSP
jgi:peptide/nickel transport system permease protein